MADISKYKPYDSNLAREWERVIASQTLSFSVFDSHVVRVLEHHRKELETYRKAILDAMPNLVAFDSLTNSIEAAKRLRSQYLVASDALKVHSSWLASPALSNIQNQLKAAESLVRTRSFHEFSIAYRIFSTIDSAALGRNNLDVEKQMRGLISNAYTAMSLCASLTNAISAPMILPSLPAFVLPGAAREIVTEAIALASASNSRSNFRHGGDADVVKQYEAELDIVESLLASIDPELVRPYRGAKEALAGSGIDRERHFLSSLRELLTHVLHKLAPDNEIKQRVSIEKPDHMQNGKPTRKARLLYMCRGINYEPLDDFVNADTNSIANLIDVLHRVHDLRPRLTDEQLKAIFLRTDSWLYYVLQVAKEN